MPASEVLEVNKIYQGDAEYTLKTFDEDTFDSFVSDPPYGLKFMGKHWDYDVPKVSIFKEMFRTLKPGGYILIACGTRTQHRMAVNIEDAGFEIRDVISWLYGCLSEDTEVLTENGWIMYRDFNLFYKNSKIVVYDVERDIYKWEKPERWSEYSVNKDTAYRIQSDYTDQVVSRNHRCLVEREGELVFVSADELNDMEKVPTLRSNFLRVQKGRQEILFERLQRNNKRSRLEKARLQREEELEGTIREGLNRKNDWRNKSFMEGRGNLSKQERVLQRSENKVCEMPERFFDNEQEGWVCNGIPISNGKTDGQSFNKGRSSTPYRPQPNEQRHNEPDVIQEQYRPQKVRMGTSYNTTLATIKPFEYSGIIFCPTVSTGAFVARRNSKIFITGNSGFPKSLDISKAIDKQAGAEREELGISPNWRDSKRDREKNGSMEVRGENAGKLWGGAITDEAKQWEGWGTALKPAQEFWTLARKPLSEKTVAENVLKHGTGGINIDACRIEGELEEGRLRHGGGIYSEKITQLNPLAINSMPSGRFPSNVILDEFMGQELDKQSGNLTSGAMTKPYEYTNNGYSLGKPTGSTRAIHESSEGGASRFFYCAKADVFQRNKGLKDFDAIFSPTMNDGIGAKEHNIETATYKRNHHPTVKPIDLMRYLVKLITPKGGLTCDPFCGSGTTLIGAKLELINYVGIEREKEYCEIAEARVAAWNPEKYKEQELF